MMETVACHSCCAYAWAGPKRSGPKSRTSPGDRHGLLFLASGYRGLKGKGWEPWDNVLIALVVGLSNESKRP